MIAAKRITGRHPNSELASSGERLPAVRRLRDTIAPDEPTALGLLANRQFARIARTLRQELRDQERESAGVLGFAGAVITQLTAPAYAIERSEDLGAGDVAQLYAPFEALIPLESLA